MHAERYRLNISDGGSGDIDEIILSDGGVVRGPDLPNWQPEYLLGICEMPTSYRGEELKYVALSPRYAGESLDRIRRSGGVVAVGRILPGRDPLVSGSFNATDVEYWAIGILSNVKERDSLAQLKVWRRFAMAAVWLIGPVLMGILAATISGEHGSVLFVAVGLYVGVSGAVSYLLLPLLPRFRRLGGTQRIAVSAGVAALPTVVLSAYFAPSAAWFFNVESGTAIVFACICAIVVAQLESRWRTQLLV